MLGGTRFVGRAVVDEALRRGHDVTVLSRGESGTPPAEVRSVVADRTEDGALAAVTGADWDAVIDTWSGAPDVVRRSTEALAGHAGWYGYVSSRSVYRWPIPVGADESAPLVDPEADEGYPADKRGAEIVVAQRFPDAHLLARAGLILGPYEDAGRLTWWLSRAATGGDLIAPLPPGRVWQYIDARDLAAFLLDAASVGTAGAFNLVCPRSLGITTKRLIDACVAVTGSRATPVWVEPAVLARAGVREWEDLPGWLAPDSEGAGMHDCDVSAALAAGLSCRPIEETVADTWDWLATIPPYRRPPRRPDLPPRGLSAEQEQAIRWLLGSG